MDMDNQDIKIKILLKDKPPTLFANANVTINTIAFGFVTIKGFCVWKSNNLNERLQEYINITPPGRMFYGKYFAQVFFESKDKWLQIEEIIYNEFLAVRNKKQHLQNEDIDLDEVDAGIEAQKQEEANKQ